MTHLPTRADMQELIEALTDLAHFGRFCNEQDENYDENRTFSSVHLKCGMFVRAKKALTTAQLLPALLDELEKRRAIIVEMIQKWGNYAELKLRLESAERERDELRRPQ